MCVTFILLAIGLAANAQASGQLASAEEFLGCREVETERLRLECYDGIADRLVAELEASVAPVALDAPKTPAAAGVEEFDEVVARVIRVVKDGRGRFVLVLDNQQRWRQVSSERFKIKVGDEVVIREAALGSFVLQQRSGGRKTKVRRQD